MVETNGEETKLANCNCVHYYRQSITWRRLVFELYRKEREFSFGHFVGLMTWHSAHARLFRKGGTNPIPDYLWSLWGEFKRKPGVRPMADTTLVLVFDALLLCFCPNAYRHLLRDALRLRLKRYRTKLERHIGLKDSVKWAEVTCRRVWLTVYNHEPAKPEKDWWRPTARAQGLSLDYSPYR